MLPSDREFLMTEEDFAQIQCLAYTLTGINLTDSKKNMVYGRLVRRLRRLKLASFREYCQILDTPNNPEIYEFVNSITTNLTSFFRESHHFDYLKNNVFPSLLENNQQSRRIRIWSAGCSTGEEPYSVAMVAKSFPQLQQWDVKILATDLDSNVVKKAKAGIYKQEVKDTIPKQYQGNVEADADTGALRITDPAKSIITFKQLNLLGDWPMRGPFDAIFCRNVVIYFDAETQKRLFDRYANLLKPDGYLFIGHSESLHNITDRFSSLGRTVYQRIR